MCVDEVPKYRKKRYKSVSKSNHKHCYKTVLLHCRCNDIFGKPYDHYSLGEKCVKCGLIKRTLIFDTEFDEAIKARRMLSRKEFYLKYKDFPLVEVDNEFALKPNEIKIED